MPTINILRALEVSMSEMLSITGVHGANYIIHSSVLKQNIMINLELKKKTAIVTFILNGQ